jgi:hypothetical protein
MGVAAVLSALVRPGVPYWLLVGPMAPFGLGFLVAQTAWTTAYMSAMPDAIVGASAGNLQGHRPHRERPGRGPAGHRRPARRPGGLSAAPGRPGPLRGAAGRGGQRPRRRAARGRRARPRRLGAVASDRRAGPAGRLYHEAYTLAVAIALLLAGGLCLLVAALAWVALEPRRAGAPAAGGASGDPYGGGALAEMGRHQALT